jgi:hypothetical protein
MRQGRNEMRRTVSPLPAALDVPESMSAEKCKSESNVTRAEDEVASGCGQRVS